MEADTTAFSLAGVGSSLPSQIVGNDEVAQLVGLTPERIRSLFDIEQRHWVRAKDSARPQAGESLGELAAQAASAALADAGLAAADVDALVVVSMTSEYVSPPLDYLVRRGIGAGEILGVTIHSACTGLFRAAAIVEGLMATGRAEVAVIVAADVPSRYFVFDRDLPKDLRMSMALYGDGAGAIVAVRSSERLPSVSSITTLTTDSPQCPGIMLSGSPARGAQDGELRLPQVAYHDFRRVLAHGGILTRQAIDAVLEKLGVGLDDVHHLITHQATGKMRRIASDLGLPADKLRVNIEKVGNTLSPSVLILLDDLKQRGVLRAGELLLFSSAESATWSYGGMAVRWR